MRPSFLFGFRTMYWLLAATAAFAGGFSIGEWLEECRLRPTLETTNELTEITKKSNEEDRQFIDAQRRTAATPDAETSPNQRRADEVGPASRAR